MSQTLAPQGLSVLTYTLSGAFFALVVYAGKELARGTRRGVLLSLIAQAAQVVHLNFVGLGVLFLAGPFVEFGASSSVLLVTAGAGAVGYLGPNAAAALLPGARLAVHAGVRLDPVTPHPTIAVGVNIVALVFAIQLWRLWHLFTPCRHPLQCQPPNMRLKLAGADRFKGNGPLCAGAHELSFKTTRRSAGESPAA